MSGVGGRCLWFGFHTCPYLPGSCAMCNPEQKPCRLTRAGQPPTRHCVWEGQVRAEYVCVCVQLHQGPMWAGGDQVVGPASLQVLAYARLVRVVRMQPMCITIGSTRVPQSNRQGWTCARHGQTGCVCLSGVPWLQLPSASASTCRVSRSLPIAASCSCDEASRLASKFVIWYALIWVGDVAFLAPKQAGLLRRLTFVRL
jgi:hypothetical protein